ncbi:hypothetical protein ZWY2020_020159 [Hordeum vulgare]|nr:hypothetical protein ZWY2020_020159 [Hordeum vulgare]
MTKSRRRKYYIDNSLWESEADSVESGYRVPFGKINVFIGMIGTPVPEPDISTDIIERAGKTRTWLRNLPPNSINTWAELKERFINNFRGPASAQ